MQKTMSNIALNIKEKNTCTFICVPAKQNSLSVIKMIKSAKYRVQLMKRITNKSRMQIYACTGCNKPMTWRQTAGAMTQWFFSGNTSNTPPLKFGYPCLLHPVHTLYRSVHWRSRHLPSGIMKNKSDETIKR